MKKIIIILIGLLATMLVLGCSPKEPQMAPERSVNYPETAPENNIENGGIEEPAQRVVEITASGFSPKTIVINSGETVSFVNKDVQPHWPASNMHPVHNTYPGSGIEKCQSSERNSIFDACGELAPDEEFTFTFTEKGNWPFHDHLHPSLIGVVTVR